MTVLYFCAGTLLPTNMREQLFIIDTADTLMDIDTNVHGDYIALTSKNEIITPAFTTRLAAGIKFPMVRQLSETLFLLASCRSDNTDNAFIYDRNGQLQQSFFAGDGIQDILVVNDKIVFTYFDEGVFGIEGPNNEGLVVFDFQGNRLFGFNSVANWAIADCYCACLFDQHSVLFYPYTEFELTELRLDTFQWKTHHIPADLNGACAISARGSEVILHGPYKHKDGLFLWNINGNKLSHQGSFGNRLKGLTDGKFMSYKKNGFGILDPFTDE